jgi:hypothetical protein
MQILYLTIIALTLVSCSSDIDQKEGNDFEEFERQATAMFRGADMDSSNSLDRSEYDSLYRDYVREELSNPNDSLSFDHNESNSDGRVTLEEFIDDERATFKCIDVNGDFRITSNEIASRQRDCSSIPD